MRSARVLTLGALVYCVMVGVGLTVANDSSKASMSGSGSDSSSMLSSEQWHLDIVYSESNDGVGSHAGATKMDWLTDWRISSSPYFGTLLAAGIGWNLVLTSGSAMLVEVVPLEDRPVAQGLSESCAIGGSFVVSAVCSDTCILMDRFEHNRYFVPGYACIGVSLGGIKALGYRMLLCSSWSSVYSVCCSFGQLDSSSWY